jgi:hypothetical protein
MQHKIRIPLDGIPASCGVCGEDFTGDLDLTVFGHVLSVTCPACFAVVAPVVAVRTGTTRP